MSSGFHYELQEAKFEQGQILRNLNGNDYRVMEKLSERNLLLMDVKTGNFIVAVGVNQYMRTPNGEEASKSNCVYGIEWGHGVYLSATPSTIDFRYIRQEYGTPERIESLTDYRKLLESRFKHYQKMLKDDLLSNEIKASVTHSMYEEFGTGAAESFMENMEVGRYDKNFKEKKVQEKGRGM